jgi:hypothetical protein
MAEVRTSEKSQPELKILSKIFTPSVIGNENFNINIIRRLYNNLVDQNKLRKV